MAQTNPIRKKINTIPDIHGTTAIDDRIDKAANLWKSYQANDDEIFCIFCYRRNAYIARGVDGRDHVYCPDCHAIIE